MFTSTGTLTDANVEGQGFNLMKIKIEIELDTNRDANEIQDLIEIVERIRDRDCEEEK